MPEGKTSRYLWQPAHHPKGTVWSSSTGHSTAGIRCFCFKHTSTMPQNHRLPSPLPSWKREMKLHKIVTDFWKSGLSLQTLPRKEPLCQHPVYKCRCELGQFFLPTPAKMKQHQHMLLQKFRSSSSTAQKKFKLLTSPSYGGQGWIATTCNFRHLSGKYT